MGATDLTISQVLPGGPSVVFGLAGDSQLSRWGMGSSGMGGWQVTDRPRQGATTEWVDYSPLQLTMSLILDGYGTSSSPTPVEQQIATVKGWELPAPGTTPPEPAKLAVAGPVDSDATNTLWVVYILTWKTAIRDAQSGVRLYQELDVTLFEYTPPKVTITNNSPAATARAMAAQNPYGAGEVLPSTTPKLTGAIVPSTSTYTVKTGDNLLAIAARQLGDASKWVQIAQLNGLRDPRNITAGQVLQMPYVPGRTKAYTSLYG